MFKKKLRLILWERVMEINHEIAKCQRLMLGYPTRKDSSKCEMLRNRIKALMIEEQVLTSKVRDLL